MKDALSKALDVMLWSNVACESSYDCYNVTSVCRLHTLCPKLIGPPLFYECSSISFSLPPACPKVQRRMSPEALASYSSIGDADYEPDLER